MARGKFLQAVGVYTYVLSLDRCNGHLIKGVMTCSIWNELSIFWSGILTLKLWYEYHASKTAMIFFDIILHSAVLISDFHIFITSSSSFSRVYNEPIQRPAPSWLVSLIGTALHRKNTTTFSDDPFLPEIFHWNDPKIRVLFTFQPDCPEIFCKW